MCDFVFFCEWQSAKESPSYFQRERPSNSCLRQELHAEKCAIQVRSLTWLQHYKVHHGPMANTSLGYTKMCVYQMQCDKSHQLYIRSTVKYLHTRVMQHMSHHVTPHHLDSRRPSWSSKASDHQYQIWKHVLVSLTFGWQSLHSPLNSFLRPSPILWWWWGCGASKRQPPLYIYFLPRKDKVIFFGVFHYFEYCFVQVSIRSYMTFSSKETPIIM